MLGSGSPVRGTGLGAAVRALEADAARPLVWATAQFISHAVPGEDLTLRGRSTG
ncbi:MAG: hypothetical protein Ct9H300mP31_14690 [Acidimicrobiaceae bacterium]|nr:MAG: hypothetical protein Ct9H300mP31_14690 [Acidimicrobiaceae bacterium]